MELFKIKFSRFVLFPLSMILGVGVISFLPFILGLLHIRIYSGSLAAFIVIVTLLSCIPLIKYIKNLKTPSLNNFKLPLLYELPFLVVFSLLMFVSVWRCYYYPPNPRDMLSGPETIAEYAVKEGTLINSVYNIDLTTTNNHLKPLYVTSLQIIYKIFVQPFGQLWLSVLVLSFLPLIITLLKQKLHPVIAWFIMIYFLGMPEVFGYTYLMLFDYSNMIFFFIGFYFLAQYLSDVTVKNYFLLSVLFFSIATYIRSETLILIGMTVPLMVYYIYRQTKNIKQILINVLIYLVCPAVVYYFCIGIFDRYYIPQHYNVATEINKNLGEVSTFFNILGDMSTKLIFSEAGAVYYGYFINLFLLIFVADLIFFRKNSSTEKMVAIYGIVLVYVGLAFLSYVFPLVDLIHTIKRGLFKMFPLMLLYFRNSGVLLWLTGIINKWEYQVPEIKQAMVPKSQPRQPQVSGKQAPPVKKK